MPNQPSFCLKKIVKGAPGAVNICESAECLSVMKERTWQYKRCHHLLEMVTQKLMKSILLLDQQWVAKAMVILAEFKMKQKLQILVIKDTMLLHEDTDLLPKYILWVDCPKRWMVGPTHMATLTWVLDPILVIWNGWSQKTRSSSVSKYLLHNMEI